MEFEIITEKAVAQKIIVGLAKNVRRDIVY